MTEKTLSAYLHLPKTGPCIRAVLFDFDGTLTLPGALDFQAIKRSMGCPLQMAILEYIDTLTEDAQKQRAIQILDQAEEEAALRSRPNAGAEALLLWLKEKGVKIGVITRNALAPVFRALENFEHLSPSDFDVLVSREDPVQPKPSPEGVFLALERLDVDRNEAILVGDYVFDIAAGNEAGVTTILVPAPGEQRDVSGWGQDLQIENLDALREIVSCHLPLPAGKLPNRFLNEFLPGLTIADPSVLIGPGTGEDTAALDIRQEEVLVLKSDPITFVTGSAARYAVTVNANDIATAGANPRWFLSTLLFPPGTTPRAILQTMLELQDFCKRQQITLCGGHTEITDAVTRPVICGMVAGTVSGNRLVDKRNLRTGDRILLTKAVAVEGTAILAQEFANRLLGKGLSDEEITWGRGLLEQISIAPEAQVAASGEGVSAMHDVTEGGLAPALEEFSHAGGHRLKIDLDRIPVMALPQRMCEALELNPLGLIGSGSLIIACSGSSLPNLLDRLKQAEIQATVIGQVLDEGFGIEAHQSGTPVRWPSFETDELARLYG